MKLLLPLITFVIGLGVGWIIFKNNEPRETNGSTKVPHPSDIAAKFSIPLPLALASELRDHYNPPSRDLKTEAVIHSFKSLQAYMKQLEEFFKTAEPPKNCVGCDSAGVALYFGKSFNGHYLLQRKFGEITKNGYLMKNNYTAFLMPVFFGEKAMPTNFRYADILGVRTLDYDYSIMVLDTSKFWSPIGNFNKSDDWSPKLKKALSKLFNDPEGFDLGHTKP